MVKQLPMGLEALEHIIEYPVLVQGLLSMPLLVKEGLKTSFKYPSAGIIYFAFLFCVLFWSRCLPIHFSAVLAFWLSTQSSGDSMP